MIPVFDVVVAVIGIFFCGLIVGYRWAWIDCCRKHQDKEWRDG